MKKNLVFAALAALLAPAAHAADARTGFTLDAVNDLRERARFPEWSQPVLPGAVDPLLAKRAPTRQSLAGPQGAAPTLSVWASTISARAGDSVDLFAQLSGMSPDTTRLVDILRANSQKLSAGVTAQIVNEAGAALGELAYADDGRGADAVAGDGIYSARWQLPARNAPALGTADSLMVKVRATLANGDVRNAVGGVQYSNPGALLTGRFRDAIKNGNLVLQAEADVLTAGRYHLTGVLANLAGAPVASAQAAQTFAAPGKYWMDLSYYGLIFQDRGAFGQLRVASASLTSTNGMPNALGPVLQNAHLTQALNPALLTKLPFNNPEMMDSARRLEATLAP